MIPKIGFALLTLLCVSSSLVYAQDADYNQGLKQELKQEDGMTVGSKKVVKKRVHKVENGQEKLAATQAKQTKKAAKKKLRAQNRALEKNLKAKEIQEQAAVKAKELQNEAKLETSVEPATPVQNVAQAEEVKNPKVLAAGLENTEPAQAVPSQGPVVLTQPSVGQFTSGGQGQFQQPQVQPIYIFSQPPQLAVAPVAAAPGATPTPQIQPSTDVEATAVPEPHSEELRKERESLEHQTENALMERLENDRLNAERERAEKIMAVQPVPSPTPAPEAVAPVVAPVGAATPAPSPEVVAPVVVAPVPAPAPVAPPVVAPAPAPAPVTDNAVTADPISSTATPAATPAPTTEAVDVGPAPVAVTPVAPTPDANASATASTADGQVAAKLGDSKPTPEEDFRRFSLGALVGVGSYTGVTNITGGFAGGALAQYKIDQHFAVQSTFSYSNYSIQNASYCYYCGGSTLIENLNQYNVTAGVNYSFFSGNITPVVGAMLDYTRRSYNNQVSYGYNYDAQTGSNAFDGGLMAGVDFHLSKSVILGAQFQYFWNLTYKTDDPLAYGYSNNAYGSPIESLGYYFATINLRFEL